MQYNNTTHTISQLAVVVVVVVVVVVTVTVLVILMRGNCVVVRW
jgi:hypothetical protein